MTAVFDKHGLRFQFPQNWEVQESHAADQALEIYLLAPSGAFWSILAFPAESDAGQVMQGVLQSFDEQYDGLETEPVEQTLANISLAGFDSNFFCLDLLVTNKMRSVLAGDHHLLIMSQAESREYEQIAPVFDAITTSLLRGLQGP